MFVIISNYVFTYTHSSFKASGNNRGYSCDVVIANVTLQLQSSMCVSTCCGFSIIVVTHPN